MMKKAKNFDVKKVKEKVSKNNRAKWWERKGSKSKKFYYVDKNGNLLKNEQDLERIKSLVIPPAWKFVRISPSKNSNMQVVGMDTGGRVQYIYLQKFREKQDKKKFAKIEKFGEHLPKFRKLTNEHLELEGLPREKVLALMTRLINTLYIRVGSQKSVKQYKTFGITTLQNRHLDIEKKGKLVFNFVGKHHIKHRKILVDDALAEIMSNMKSIGSKGKLFNYLDDQGNSHPIKPEDINQYLKLAIAPEFSAKDFRTWGGTLLAALELAQLGKAEDEKLIKKNIVKAVKKVAEQLGNTPTVCRKSYIHPTVIKSYESGKTLFEFTEKKKRKIKRIQEHNEPEEEALIKLFQTTF